MLFDNLCVNNLHRSKKWIIPFIKKEKKECMADVAISAHFKDLYVPFKKYLENLEISNQILYSFSVSSFNIKAIIAMSEQAAS